jgi:Cu/Ag efflux pump CusA
MDVGGDHAGLVAGFVQVLGLAVRSAVVLVRHYQELEQAGQPFGADLVIRGTGDRLVPLLTSAFAGIAVFLPLLVAGGAGGLELVGPMAVVVLGGLVTSTVLGVFVLPALYLRFGFVAERDTSAEDLFEDGMTVADGVGG